MHVPTPTSPGPGTHSDLLRALLKATIDFVWVKDLAGCYVAINSEGARLIGMTPEQIVGKDDFALFPLEIAQRFVAEDRAVQAAGASLTFESEVQLGDRTVHMNTAKSPWRSEDGEVIGTVGISRDVTGQKRVEAALKEAQSRFQMLFDSDLFGMHIPDRFGAITEANDEFLRITGYTREDLEAGVVRWDWMTPPEYDALDRTHIAEAAERGTCTPYEKEYVRKDGSRVPIMCGYTLLQGSQDRYIGFIQDMTAVRKSEEALRQAEKLNMASRFAASMAHEINNPLAAVTNLIYLASKDESVHGETRALLQAADRELARISRVVAQTLRFHRQSTAPVQADLCEIMESVFPLFSSRTRGDRIVFEREYSSVPPIWCFHHELRHAFANLIGNALDAIPRSGRIRVRVRSAHRWDHTPQLGIVVVVADTGTGIPPAMRNRLFEPFLSTKDKTGTGLGLWATDNIVRKHRGRIRVRTADHPARHGTVFSLFFPLSGIEPDPQ